MAKAEEDTEALFGDQPGMGQATGAPQSKSGPVDEPGSDNIPPSPVETIAKAVVGQALAQKVDAEVYGKTPRPTRDPASVKSITDLMKACHADFGMQPKQVLKELGYSSQSDIAVAPSECYTTIVALRCEAP